jgi:hypothetical protein
LCLFFLLASLLIGADQIWQAFDDGMKSSTSIKNMLSIMLGDEQKVLMLSQLLIGS